MAASLLATLAVVPLAAADDLKDKKREVERHITGASADVEESSARLRAAAAALQAAQGELQTARADLAAAQGELTVARVKDQQMQAKLDAAVARLRQARRDLANGRAEIVREQDRLGRIVVANYQSGDPELMGLSMVLTSQDPAELTGQLSAVQTVMDKESVVLDRFEASKALLIVQAEEVRAAKAAVARQRRAAARQLAHSRRLEAQAEAAEARVQDLVATRTRARAEAEQARVADLAQLASLEQERDRISAMLRQRAEAARRRAEAAAAAKAAKEAAAAAAAADAAAAAKAAESAPEVTSPVQSNGYLDLPVPGAVTSAYGFRVHPIFGYRALHDGVDLAAPCGSPVRAAAPGRVLEEYFQSAWGNRIIIDHGFHDGVGLATISNHLSRYAVSPGERVERGQVVGYAGTTGWSTGCHLHFTVLANGSPVDPMSWF